MKPNFNAPVPISSQENDHIIDYIKSHNAAVLTIMFTDIVGFTEITEKKGDQFSSRIHQKHDQLLSDIIEKQYSGLVIKFIGDSVMAIFAEPSVGVETAIAIQQKIKQLTVDDKALSIRIGLHVGQVSVENDVQLDIFGRHVNRASRIENLAQGDQILMSYSVFDSASGWLKSQSNLAWKDHGFYKLKGITEKVNVFEVYLPSTNSARKPKQGAVYSVNFIYVYAISFLVSMSIFYYSYQEYIVPKLFFIEQQSRELRIVDTHQHDELVVLDGKNQFKNNGLFKSEYLLYYPISKFERQYSIISVNYGVNNINTDYDSWVLPRLNFYNIKQGINKYNQEFEVLYWQDGIMKIQNFYLSMTIEKINNLVDFNFVIEKSNHIDTYKTKIELSEKRIEHFEDEIIWQDSLFNLTLKAHQTNGSLTGELVGHFK